MASRSQTRKLTNNQRAIALRLAAGESQSGVARRLRVTRSYVHQIAVRTGFVAEPSEVRARRLVRRAAWQRARRAVRREQYLATTLRHVLQASSFNAGPERVSWIRCTCSLIVGGPTAEVVEEAYAGHQAAVRTARREAAAKAKAAAAADAGIGAS